MSTRETHTQCRICFGVCSLRLTLDDSDRIISIRGDKSNPLTRGFACVKGTNLHEAHYHSDRILRPLKRQADGSFATISLDTALGEITAKLQDIIARCGPDAVGGVRGTATYLNITANHMQPAWLAAIGSKSFFSTMTIDQSAKWVAVERLGVWGAGIQSYRDADVLMMVGVNPLVSLGAGNFSNQDPVKRMRDARARGMKLVVVDPRRTETARHADVLLQPLPGEDVTVMAGLLHIVLRERWHDAEFCARHVSNLEGLIQAIEPHTPEYVARRADVAVDDLLAAARLFAEPVVTAEGRRHKRGAVASGTAPNMGPHSNLAEHLVQCLNVVCGRFARQGELVPNPGVMAPRAPQLAAVYPPSRSWESGWRSRVGNVGMLFGEKMCGVLAQEILTPGPDQIRSLFVVGGNPVNAVPGEKKMTEAFRDLELLVTIDPFMSDTARLSHYILPPKMMLERHDMSSRDWESFMTPIPYTQYSPPVIPVPAGSELVDDWYVFWALAKRMGKTIVFDGVPLTSDVPPTSEELLAIVARHSPVSFDEIKRHPQGKVYDVPPMVVQPATEAHTGRFEVIPDDVRQELAEVQQEEQSKQRGEFGFRLSVRRIREAMNSGYRNVPAISRMVPYNPAHIHPEDLSELCIASGDDVLITSSYGSVRAIAEADDSLRRGVVSMTHGWGGVPDGEPGTPSGVNVNRLTSSERFEPINGMPVMTGVPVKVERYVKAA